MKGFSLIELLVAITIISIIVALSLKPIGRAYKKSLSKLKKSERYHKERLNYGIVDNSNDPKDLQMRISRNQDIYFGYNHNWKPMDTNIFKN